MLRSATLLTSILAAALGCEGLQGAELKVGDPAPALEISKWVKGKPIVLAEGKDKHIYVVEFWATWCGPCVQSIPHLTKMAKRFEKDGVVFIGVSIDGPNSVENVDPFVKRMGKKMDYTVALDNGEATNKAWLDAAGAKGIPHSFVVDKKGNIAWHGHPMSGLDVQLATLVGDKAYAESKKKVQEAKEKLGTAWRGQKWEEAVAALDHLVELEPEEHEHLVGKYYLLTAKKKDKAEAEKVGQTILKKVSDSDELNELAWGILTSEEFAEGRDPGLALALSKKANELSEGKNWSVLDTYARALFDTGSAAEAVTHQKKAVEIATQEKIDEEQIENLKQALEKFQKGAPGSAEPKKEPKPEEKPKEE